MTRFILFAILLILVASSCTSKKEYVKEPGPRKIEILFLGHDSEHHNSAKYLPLLSSTLSGEGINFTYTDDPASLNSETLGKYDALMIYANHEKITDDQEKALIEFVKDGNGFIPVHCASFCFQNSEAYIDLVGGQFLKHDTATFQATIIQPTHPAMSQVKEFTTWDETYIHDKLTDDRTVLMERVEGEHREPWTWVKQLGKGRVFYTAYGHDERTWNSAGFQQLIKAGILWAVGDAVAEQWRTYRKEMPELVYRDEPNIPNYEKRTPWPQYQEPLSPEESKKLIQVPVGFKLELFASEPDIFNPIAMDWDERGRLWVIETVDYPNSVKEENGVGDDRIKICEDTDGDGKADKFTVFADSLNIPTSLVFSNGGIIVSQAPHFLFLKDTNGDDKADTKEVLIDGWGTFDTHAGPSNLKYGVDNSIWGVVGYSGFKGNIAGKTWSFTQGVYRFKPDVSEFEFVTNTSNNTWGVGFTENNDVFASTANNNHSVFVGIPNRLTEHVQGIPRSGSLKIDGHYDMHPITEKVRQVDVFGGFTAAAGHSFYTARSFPKEYWNNVAFVCEPTGHLVHLANIEKEGAGFREKDGWNIFASSDEWVSPVEAKVGPDGAVWVLDWYDFIIQHNPTPTPERGGYEAETGKGNAYENPLRDKKHGRVWRVVASDSEPSKPIQLSIEDPQALMAALKNDNMFWRTTAQRLLVERNKKDVVDDLVELAASEKVDSEGNNFSALHALWTLHGLGAFDAAKTNEVLKQSLQHPSAGVRRAAIQIITRLSWPVSEISPYQVSEESDPGTQLSGILMLADAKTSDTIGNQLYALSKKEQIKKDIWLSRAVYIAASHHSDAFLSAYHKDHGNAHANTNDEKVIAREVSTLDDRNWKKMKLPGHFEDAGLDMDGVVWFRTDIQLESSAAGKQGSLSLGPIDDSDVTWLNGVKVGETTQRWSEKRNYKIPSGILKAGKNVLAIRVEDTGGGGGIYGNQEDLFLAVGGKKILLSGEWRYDIEKTTTGMSNDIFENSSIAELFAKNYQGATQSQTASEPTITLDGTTVINLKVIKNKMKYDLQTFQVVAGKPVEIIFSNPDFMQHNLVITKPGSLEILGKAADKLASDPKGADLQYVPKIPEVMYSTKLVDPQETVRLTFTAPLAEGDYPFVCTFPGHWSVMNGIMKVVKNNKPL